MVRVLMGGVAKSRSPPQSTPSTTLPVKLIAPTTLTPVCFVTSPTNSFMNIWGEMKTRSVLATNKQWIAYKIPMLRTVYTYDSLHN